MDTVFLRVIAVDDPVSKCCGAPVETETVRGRLNDRRQEQKCSECGADLDILDVEYEQSSRD